ncbi:DUF368 domain-containing protein [Mucisphaera calidilacus]|uniref:DUF368 domain-containing protein n=1 Tax=Mucisphaera calidilacus TaxID=2527982 RepID=A0A518BZB8_9BACT|nr:DUF368 domain-containing protein [Mucisphaera calidilacus]QDU72317.1 hypothetical protein Pan265_21820 [Mucisphaera calidilacus]
MEPTSDPPADATPIPLLMIRSALGGVLMGLANLVPGISGGTMLLAAGIYPRFIDAIGEVTTLRFRTRSVLTLGTVVVAAVLAIALLALPVKNLVVDHRWVMYSLFIGLTLGGVPVVWRLIGRPGVAVWFGAAAGFVGMAALAYAQSSGLSGGAGGNDGFVFMLLAGLAGASAMILPGVSGGYLLLVLGAYVPLLAGIGAFTQALRAGDSEQLVSVGLTTILPVGLGVVVGIVAVSNLLRWLLHRYEQATLGVLLGLLLGAVVGLYPFVEPVRPEIGDRLKGQTVMSDPGDETGERLMFEATGKPVERDDWAVEVFSPTSGTVAGGVGLIVAGFAITQLIDRFGRDRPHVNPASPEASS